MARGRGLKPGARGYTRAMTARRPPMTNPTAAMLVIGDEILSGRTRDSNMHYLARRTDPHRHHAGARCGWWPTIHAAIVAAVNALRACVRPCLHLAAASARPMTTSPPMPSPRPLACAISHRADAMALLQAHYDRAGLPFNEARQRMARIPDGASADRQPGLDRAGLHHRQCACDGRRAEDLRGDGRRAFCRR